MWRRSGYSQHCPVMLIRACFFHRLCLRSSISVIWRALIVLCSLRYWSARFVQSRVLWSPFRLCIYLAVPFLFISLFFSSLRTITNTTSPVSWISFLLRYQNEDYVPLSSKEPTISGKKINPMNLKMVPKLFFFVFFFIGSVVDI